MDIEDTITNTNSNFKPFWLKSITENDKLIFYSFLDKYYNTDIPKSNIKNDFINYCKSFNSFKKFGYLIYFYYLARQSGKYPIKDLELEKYLKVKEVRENHGKLIFSVFTSGSPQWTKTNPDGTTTIIKDYDDSYTSSNPGKWSCRYNCYYCPDEPGQPRSYVSGEPGVDRAVENCFDPIKQIFARASQYVQQGKQLDKAEVIIQGGTWDCYSIEYRTEFIRDIYYAFNNVIKYILNQELPTKLSMEEEIKINETAPTRVIGLTPETRPDQINSGTIRFLRKIGATKVQIGVQHLKDSILYHINRRCDYSDIKKAIRMLKDNCFKVSIHIMFDLPAPLEYINKMPEIDRWMIDEINNNPDLKTDEIKYYPCMTIPYTKIKQWYESGYYKPYGDEPELSPEEKKQFKKLSDLDKIKYRLKNPLYYNMMYAYTTIDPQRRIDRIIRDIPTTMVCGGTKRSGMRSELDMDLEKLDQLSPLERSELLGITGKETIGDIRYREVGNVRNINRKHKLEPILKEYKFESSRAIEYFLSFETDEKKPLLYSFLRLRLPKNNKDVVFNELKDVAMIREVQTYGKMTPCKENEKYYEDTILFGIDKDDKTQHKGYGKKLIERAEEIAYFNGYYKMVVIAGVGVREYYRKLGYTQDTKEGCYQLKYLDVYKTGIYADYTGKIINL